MIIMRSLSIVVMSQIKLIPTSSWLVYFVLKAQPFFINFGVGVLFAYKGAHTLFTSQTERERERERESEREREREM